MSSRLEFYKGSDANIRDLLTDIVDGRLMFAVDTKQIYLDYNVPDGPLAGPERIKFGGSTGIYYAEEKSFEDGEQPIFNLNDLSGDVRDYPSVNDLILNEKDGSFYRVTEINANTDEIYVKRLTVSGSGGGGGGGSTDNTGYVERKLLGSLTSSRRYFSVKSTEFNIPFLVRSSEGEDVRITAAHIYQVVDKGQSTEKEIYIRDIENIRPSWDENNPTLLDFRPIMKQINFVNTAEYHFVVIFEDEFENVSRKVSFSITAFDITVQPVDTELTTAVGSTLNYWFTPNYYRRLQNVTAKIEIIHIATKTHFPQPDILLSDSGTAYKATLDVGGLANGAYMIQTTLTALIPDTTDSVVESDVLTQIFIKQSPSKSDPIIACVFPEPIINNEYAYNQYESISIDFKVSYSESTIPIVREVAFTPPGALEPEITTGEYNIDTEKTITWNYQFLKKGSYKFTIYAGETGFVKTSSNIYTIAEESDKVPSLIKNNLVVNLSPADKENSSVDRDKWISAIGDNVATGVLTGFNWTSNGWLKEDYKDEQGNSIAEVPYLYLTNGAKLVVNYSPFARATENQISYGAERYGKAIEFDVSIDNVRDRSQELIKCLSRTNILEEGKIVGQTLHSGVVVNGDYFMINNSAQKPLEEYYEKGYVDLAMSGMTATYNNGERVHVTFIVTPKKKEDDQATNAAGLPLNMMCTYINGVLSGLVAYSDTTTFMDAEGDALTEDSNKFIFDSTYADLKVYNLRVYDTVLTDQAVLTNYLATLPTVAEMTERFDDNSILDEDGNISLTLVRQKGNIPYILFRGGRKVTDKKGETYAHENQASASGGTGAKWLSLPEAKDDYRLVDMCFIDPEHPNRNIGSFVDDQGTSSDRIKTVIYAQGTSSMGYPVKNLRMKFAKSAKYSYSLEPEEKDANGNIVTREIPEVDLFCLKADYMESSSSHNTGFCNLLGSIYGNLKTPAQLYQPDKQIVTAIKGKPIVIFYRETDEDLNTLESMGDNENEYRYIGRYNFNLDKGTHEPFGFFSDYENRYGIAIVNPPDAQEIATKGYAKAIKDKTPISGYHATLDEAPIKGKTYYKDPEGTIPWNYDDLWKVNDKGKIVWAIKQPAYELRTAPASLTGLSETELNAVGMNSIQCWECLDNGLVHVNFQQPWTEETGVDAWVENFESRYPEYEEQEMSDKRALQRVLNWVASTNARNATGAERERLLKKFKDEFELYFDKNLTLLYYILTEFFIMMDSRGKNMMLCTFTANCKDENGNDVAKWFPIFYDADTQCCVDNTGALRFRYKDEDTFKNIFNAEASYEYPVGSEDAGQGNSGRYSVLWTNINLTMYDDIKTLYRQLRQGAFNYASLINSYNANQSNAWNETYTNKDAYVKYINPYLEDPAGGVLLYAAQGTRSLHREKFFRQRFSYMDSKYAYIYGGVTLDWRINNLDGADQYVFKPEGPYVIEEYVTVNGVEELQTYEIVFADGAYSYTDYSGTVHTSETLFENAVPADSARIENKIFRFNNLKVRDAMYPCFHVGNRGSDPMNTTRFDRVDEGATLDTLLVSNNVATQAEQPFYVDMADNWVSLGDLSNKGISRFTKTTSSSSELRLNNVIVSTNEPGYEDLLNGIIPSQLEIPNALPMLEELNVAYWPKLGALNLRSNVNLKKLYAYGSVLNSCTLPVGGILEEIQLPATLQEISIVGHNNLTSFGYAQYNQTTNRLEENAWKNLTRIHVEQCANLDTKSIISQMSGGARVKLPDINWVFEKADFETNVENVITSIPLLEKLISMPGFDGELAIDANGNKILGRSYVQGTVLIKNRMSGSIVDEGMLYDKYLKYFPYINIVTEDENHKIPAYGFNVYNANGVLMPFNTIKFKEEQLNQFTLENCFGVKDNLKLLPIDREQSDEYIYIFKGWNKKEVEFFSERDFNSYEEMDAKANENLVVEYVDGEYQVRNNFDFESYFSETITNLNVYPTFLAKVREFEVRFWDGQATESNNYGSLLQSTRIKYGDIATPPVEQPVLVELNESKLDAADVFLFNYYNNKNGIKETSFIIISETDYIAQYNTSKAVSIKEYPAAEGHFLIDASGFITFNEQKPYTAKAICIPKQINGTMIKGLNNMTANPNIQRFFFEADNEIHTIAEYAFAESQSIEYIDFYALKNLLAINSYAFQKCINLRASNFYDNSKSNLIIGMFAFNGCTKLNFTALPSSLAELNSSCFYGCDGLQELNMSMCSKLELIPASCFTNCDYLTITGEDLPVGVTKIGQSAFSANLALVFNFASNTSIVEFEKQAFYRSPKITMMSLPVNLAIIGDQAFASTGETAQLAFTKMPKTLTTMGSKIFANSAITAGFLDFRNCSKLTANSFKSDTFASVRGLTNIILPSALQSSLTVPDDRWGAGSNVTITYK